MMSIKVVLPAPDGPMIAVSAECRMDPVTLASTFLPFVFSAMAIDAVGRPAMAMIQEVRRQFRSIPELSSALDAMRRNDGKPVDQWSADDQEIYRAADGKPEYGSCVKISTEAAIISMIKPGLVAVLTPIVIGFGFKIFLGDGKAAAEALGGGRSAQGHLRPFAQHPAQVDERHRARDSAAARRVKDAVGRSTAPQP